MFRADVIRQATKAEPRRRKTKTLPPIGHTLASELELRRLINRVLRKAAAFVRERGLQQASALKTALQVDHAMTADVEPFITGMEIFNKLFVNYLDLMINSLQPYIRRVHSEEGLKHQRRFEASIKTGLGLDVSATLQSEDVRPQIEAATLNSVTNIKGLTDELAKRVQNTLINGAIQEQPQTEIAKVLSDQFGWSAQRAASIARDQMATFNGMVNKVRQQQLGIDKYIWNTMNDERVRLEHERREGKIFRWDSPPEDGHPGEPINCRCVAAAYIG